MWKKKWEMMEHLTSTNYYHERVFFVENDFGGVGKTGSVEEELEK